MGTSAQQLAQQAAQQNAAARLLIQTQSQEMKQQIFSQTFNPATQNVVNIIPRNVGLIKGFWVKVVANVTNNDGGNAITPTDFGAANVLQQVVFTDLQNNVRIQTTGWHVNFVDSVKGKFPYGVAFTQASTDDPIGYGANWTVQQQTNPIAKGGATGTVTMWYWVPLAYSDEDYRGAIYANVYNATMQLQVTFNSGNFSVATGADSTLAVYHGSANANVAVGTFSVTVYQVYMDQIPMANGIPILPMSDLATVYELKNTQFTAITAGQDFPMQYANYRDFVSTFAVYNHDPSADSGRVVGADVNYWALQVANFTNIFKVEPNLVALWTRNHMHTDTPKGVYYFSSRRKPISSNQYGNIELVLNAITAAAGAYLLVGYEDFGIVNTLPVAGSLPAA